MYLPNTTAGAPVLPAYGSQWNVIPKGVARAKTSTVKSNTAVSSETSVNYPETSSAQVNVLHHQYVSDPLPATKTIGSGTFKGVVRGGENATTNDLSLQVVVRVVSNNGTTQRGVLYAGHAAALNSTAGALGQEFSTASQTRIIPAGTPLRPVAVQEGDRLVIEIGHRAHNTSTSLAHGWNTRGDATATADHTHSAGATTSLVPWMEFTEDLFAAPPPVLWGDEFNDTTIDPTKWFVRNNDYNSNEQSCLFSSQVSEASGSLSIRVNKGTYTCGSRSSQFASGYVDSINKTPSFGVGTKWEFRAKMPITLNQSQGYWPALWMRSNESDSTYQNGEIDTVEVWGSAKPDVADSDHKAVVTVHEDTNVPGGNKSGYVFTFPSPAHSGDGFHTYATELYSDRVDFLIDGVRVRSVTTAANPWLASQLASGVKWNVRMNIQVCSPNPAWCNVPNTSTLFPQTMNVDWVRVTNIP